MEEIKTEEIKKETVEKTFTQEEVNDIVKERLDRAEKKWQEKYSNYYSADDLANKTEELNSKIAELGNTLNLANDKATADGEEISKRDQTIADLEAKLRQNETDSAKIRIGLAKGIPYELCNRLSGSNEEEILADAEKFTAFLPKQTMPLRNPEATQEVDGVTQAFKKLNPNIKI